LNLLRSDICGRFVDVTCEVHAPRTSWPFCFSWTADAVPYSVLI